MFTGAEAGAEAGAGSRKKIPEAASKEDSSESLVPPTCPKDNQRYYQIVEECGIQLVTIHSPGPDLGSNRTVGPSRVADPGPVESM